jgi:hydrogenase-4 component B
MIWILIALLLFFFSGISGLFLKKDSRGGELSFAALMLGGGVAGFVGLVQFYLMNTALVWSDWSLVPMGPLSFRLDAISAIFLFPVFLIAPLGALYGVHYYPQARHSATGRRFRLFYGLISAATTGILIADNSLLFLIQWEIMAISGYFLVSTEDRDEEVRRAGYIYFLSTRTGTLALIAAFILISVSGNGFLFPASGSLPATQIAAFFLFLFGFGIKAGFMPLHIWLPGAHSAAPSHASALLSGIIIKLGIYGMVRITSFYAEVPPFFGWTLLGIGAVSGILGVALALAQHDIKRLLAYHSVENIGIIAMGLGLALLGRTYDEPRLILLGLGGALLHVVNHGLFKSLLFFSAGSVINATGTRSIDSYGGLLRAQPWTAFFFLVGAVAISGLPPFNGFVSEWLIFIGATETVRGAAPVAPMAVLAAPALALIGGLALACFVKVYGIAFLGEPRTAAAAEAKESGACVIIAMAPLAIACVVIGIAPTLVMPFLEQAVALWAPGTGGEALSLTSGPMSLVSLYAAILLVLTVIWLFWLIRRTRKARRDVGTWGCGYTFPSSRMQYTASSFADGLVGLFRFGLFTDQSDTGISKLFPESGHFHSHTPDGVLDRVLLPTFRRAGQTFVWIRAHIQNGIISFYLMCVALTVVVLLLVSL